MRILLVTEFFPPHNAMGSLRLYSFAKYWQKAGHEITVYTALKAKRDRDLNLDCSLFNIIRIPIPFSSQISDIYLGSNSAVKNKSSSSLKKILSPAIKLFELFRKKTGCFSGHFPNFCDLWAKKVINRLNADNFDIVLSSAGPYSVHRVGLALKKKNPKIKWIVDWRDLWTKDAIKGGLLIFRPYEKYLENIFHKNADLITTVADPLNAHLKTITKTNVKTIFNGFDPDDYIEILKNKREKNDNYTIVYTGSLYRNIQNVSPLFEAVSYIKNKDISLYKKIKIIFSGANADVSDIAEKYDILDSYTYLGYTKREEALRLQYFSDAVLFIDYKGKTDGILSGKIFEYISLSKKIIIIGHNGASTAVELIKKTNTGIFLGNNKNLIAEYLISCLNNTCEDIYQKNQSVINEYTRENQAKKLMNFVLHSGESNG